MAQRANSSTRVNHFKLNHQQVKEQEALNRERVRQDEYEKERMARVQQAQKSKYNHVQPTVNRQGQVAQAPANERGGSNSDDVEITVFVRECDENAHMFRIMESAAKQSSSPARGPGGAGSGGVGARPPLGNNSNVRSASSAPKFGGAEPPAQRGTVPEYLRQRKAEAAAEKALVERQRQEDAERSKWPPGHRPMLEEERLELLARLEKRKKELEYDLVRIPVRIDTLAVQRRRQQIETEMSEVETAITKFSVKKQLFVPL